jgi:feruloyl-CoA synthase
LPQAARINGRKTRPTVKVQPQPPNPADSSSVPTRPVALAPRAGKAVARPDGTILVSSTLPLAPYPESWNIKLREWALRTPDRIFLTESDQRGGRHALTFAATLAAIRRIGAGLLELGLDQERPLAILSENSIDCALVTLASLWVGIPASPISPAYALKATEFSKLSGVLESLSPGAIFVADGARYGAAVRGACADAIPVISGGAPVAGRATRRLADLQKAEAGAAEIAANAAVTGATIAKIMFTSGSSGAPKPVILPHRMLAANRQQNAQAFRFMLDAPPVMVDWLPWHHTFGGNNNFGFALWCGGTFHIDDGAPTPAGIGRTVALLAAHPPSFYINTPSGFDALLPHLAGDRGFAEKFFSRLKLMQYGSAVLSVHIWRALDAVAVATIGQRILMVAGVGSTECGPTPVQSSWEQHLKPEAGLPLPGVEVKLVPTQGTWELRMRGDCVTPGYWRRPDLTQQALDDEGFFLTGDAVKPLDPDDFAQGLLFDGRISDNFKLSSGTWVAANKLRSQLIGALAPLVRDAVITGHDRSEVGAIGFPDMAFARELTGASPQTEDDAVLADPVLRSWVTDRLAALAGRALGSSERILRLVLDAEPPTFDNGELTDKGVAASRIVRLRRAGVVEALHAADPKPPFYALH